MTTDTVALSTAWIHQPARGKAPARTLLVGAAILTTRFCFGRLAFNLAGHSTTVTDDPAETLGWLAERLHVPPARLLLWRAEDIVIPSLISAYETARDAITAARLLRELDLTLGGEVIDVADVYRGGKATSFDAVSHGAGFPFRPMSKELLHASHRTSCHGAIRTHLAYRAICTWRLWLKSREDAGSLINATDAWVATPDAQVRL